MGGRGQRPIRSRLPPSHLPPLPLEVGVVGAISASPCPTPGQLSGNPLVLPLTRRHPQVYSHFGMSLDRVPCEPVSERETRSTDLPFASSVVLRFRPDIATNREPRQSAKEAYLVPRFGKLPGFQSAAKRNDGGGTGNAWSSPTTRMPPGLPCRRSHAAGSRVDTPVAGGPQEGSMDPRLSVGGGSPSDRRMANRRAQAPRP
jgi:hypothetical protein